MTDLVSRPNGFVLRRVLADGRRDERYGGEGCQVFLRDLSVAAVAATPDGGVLLAFHDEAPFAIARFDGGGRPDQQVGAGTDLPGFTAVPGVEGFPASLVVRPDGRSVVLVTAGDAVAATS